MRRNMDFNLGMVVGLTMGTIALIIKCSWWVLLGAFFVSVGYIIYDYTKE